MSARATAIQAEPALPLSAKDKAFWYAVWWLDAMSYIAIALIVFFIGGRLGGGAVNAGIVLAISVFVFGLSRYGLWRLTRPYATIADAVMPAVNRAQLCNIDFKLLFFGLAMMPSTEFVFQSGYTIVYAVLAAVVIVGWVALMGPLQAANARDAARNLGQQAPQS